MPAIDCTRCFSPGNSGTSAYRQRESADGLSFLLHPRFSGVWFFSFESMCDIVKLHPARGRNPAGVLEEPLDLVLQFIPVRGRKLLSAGLHDLVNVLQFIPVRGRKPFLLFTFIIYHYCNLSPQGDKKAPLPLAFASSGGALLFLIFYFTGWELRLPESSL